MWGLRTRKNLFYTWLPRETLKVFLSLLSLKTQGLSMSLTANSSDS